MQAPAHSSIDRVVTFDVLRGLAIGGMVFLHNGAFHLASLGETLKSPPPWLVAFGFLLLWAGLFGVVSGAANATATLRRLQQPTTKGQAWRYPRSLTAGALQTFVILFALHWAWTLVLGNSAVTADPQDPTLRVTLVPGLIYYGFFPRIHPENWVFASALWMIGSNVLLLALTLHWFYRRHPPRDDDGLQRFLLLLAATVLLATPALRTLLFEPMMKLVGRGGASIAAAIPAALLINDPNPVFPFFAYGLLGAIVGVSLVRGEPRSRLYRRLGWSGLALVLLGGAGLTAAGGLILAEREQIWGQSPVYFAALSYVLLGIFAWLLIGLLALLDPDAASSRSPWRPRALRPILRFGRVSLTIFLLEGVVAMILRVVADAIVPRWNTTLGVVLAFAAGNVLLWHVILLIWERYEYRFAMEWWLARIRGTEDRAQALRLKGHPR
jgi:hypothetical protein